MRYGKYAIHMLVWIILYLLPFAPSLDRLANSGQLGHELGNPIHVVSTLFLVGFCYLNYYVLIPQLFLRHQYLFYFLAIVAGLFIIIELPMLVAAPMRPPGMDFPPPHHPHGGGPRDAFLYGRSYNIFLYIVLLFISITLRTRLQVLRLQQEKTDAELAFLKAQVHPHFLFNALNGIYALALKGSPRTADAVLQLSGLMRYLLNEAREEVVPLQRELEYVDHYIRLQQLRIGETVRVDYSVSGSADGLRIAPLLLLPFVENAFKHGANPDADSLIRVAIKVQEEVLHLMVMNRKVSGGERAESSGIGLPNVQARLGQHYPKRHDLQIDDRPDLYAVNLTIHL